MKYCLAALLVCSSFHALAEDNHALAIALNLGDTSSNSKTIETDNGKIGLDFSYRYQLDNNWGIEAGYKSVDTEPLELIFNHVLNISALDALDSFRLAGVYSQPLSERNRIVFKLGAQRYSTEFDQKVSNTETRTYTKTGEGVYGAIGWQYQFDFGGEINFFYDYSKMDKVDLKTFNLGFGYRF
ncbi:porin family protein [Parashewanella curva]|nr:porin family protein [Parashewanella curva]